MKYFLIVLVFAHLASCQDTDTNTGVGIGEKAGYVAGYRLTCGLSWNGENRLVVDKEFARDFLDGSIVCVREHPELARQVLGLANDSRTTPAREDGKGTEAVAVDVEQSKPVPEQTPEAPESLASTAHPGNTAEAPAEAAKKASPRRSKTPQKVVTASAKKKASVSAAKAPQNAAKVPKKPAKAPEKAANAPKKSAKTPEKQAEAPARSTESKATATAAPAGAKASAKPAKPATRSVAAPAPKPKIPAPSAEGTRAKQERPSRPLSDYDRLMGRY
ncbi:MAG: hypothetical protein LJE70_09685 [Chromatiaceae bacterium]|nr:hypothetical protein [Chromatiaceae bacterium]